jgi:hypothetical protein
MKIDKTKALEILEEETILSKTEIPDEIWVSIFDKIYKLTQESGQTIIAALGTAILAKATELDVDVFSLKVGDGSNAHSYSARALCKEVLAANAPRLGLDLGVHGREPLNNQPFFGKTTIYEARDSSHDKTREAMNLLIDCLDKIAAILTIDAARIALRAFIKTRSIATPELPPINFNPQNLSREGLLSHIENFVTTQSEHGKRAQSVVAGLLDAQDCEARVRVAKIHDPDRNFPGDVALLDSLEAIWIAFEVRDKPVSAYDLDHFVVKCNAHNVSRATIIACIHSPDTTETNEAKRRAESNGVFLSLYGSWREFLDDILMWSHHPKNIILSSILERVLIRAAELEVSEAGLQLWAQG